jgi:hypothetical protein
MAFKHDGILISFQSKFTNQYKTPQVTGYKDNGNDLSNVYAPWDNLTENKAPLSGFKINGTTDLNTIFNKVSPNLYLKTFDCDYPPGSNIQCIVLDPQPNVYSNNVFVSSGAVGKYSFTASNVTKTLANGIVVTTTHNATAPGDYVPRITGNANIVPVVTGAMAWVLPGNYTWTVPQGVMSISAVVIGAGGGGYGNGVPGGEGGASQIQIGSSSVIAYGGGGGDTNPPSNAPPAYATNIPANLVSGRSSEYNSSSSNYGAGGAGGPGYDPNYTSSSGNYTGTVSQNGSHGGGGAGGGGSHAGGGGGGTSLFGCPLDNSGGIGGVSGSSGTGGTAINVTSVALNIASNGATATGGSGQKGAGAGGNFGGGGGSWEKCGGASGALAYFNNYQVTPGQVITITVGEGGTADGYGGAGGSGGVRIVYPGNIRTYPYNAQDVYPGAYLTTSNVCNERVYVPPLFGGTVTYNPLDTLTVAPTYSITQTSNINVSYSVPVFYKFVFMRKDGTQSYTFNTELKGTSYVFNTSVLNIDPGLHYGIIYAYNEGSISKHTDILSINKI